MIVELRTYTLKPLRTAEFLSLSGKLGAQMRATVSSFGPLLLSKVLGLNETQAVVATVDFFPPIVDDPYVWGQIAAANSLSDIYAMGATPLTALNLVGWPRTALMIGAAAYPLVMDDRTQSALAKKDLDALGASAAAAGCTEVEAKEATGSADHREPGSDLPYTDSPPATGPHYPTWAPMERKFYTAQDRPDRGRSTITLDISLRMGRAV